jgi:hypothetical protein
MKSELDFLKFLERYGEDVEIADFSPEELEELMRELEEQGDRPLTVEEFKEKYFEFYDDVKEKTRKRQDW